MSRVMRPILFIIFAKLRKEVREFPVAKLGLEKQRVCLDVNEKPTRKLRFKKIPHEAGVFY
jgi:hypothetical protein